MRQQRRQTREAAHAALTPRDWKGAIGMLLAAACVAAGAAGTQAQEGKALFESKCAACHNIGGGPKVGPDLKEVLAKRGKEGMVAVVLDPAKAGLKPAMPNLGLPGKDAEAIVAYVGEVKEAGSAAAAKGAAPAAQEPSAAEPQQDEIRRGRDLFEGRLRFAGGGPSCIACHDVRNDDVAGGGILAAELTLVFSRMGRQGVQSILANTPFPVMQAAYQGKELSETEIAALIAFLQNADKEHARQMPRETGWRVFSSGVGGVIVLVGIFSLAGRRRKSRSVNQDIYDRQLKSE